MVSNDSSSSAPSSSSRKLRVAICGGGIGGLTLAIGLLRLPQLSVHIYESASRFAEIGAGISFGPNAVRAMGLIAPEVKEAYGRRSTKNGWDSKSDVWFDFRWGMDMGQGKGRSGEWIHAAIAKGTGQSSVHRAHFLDELVKLIPDSCATFGKRVEEISELPDKTLRMRFADGTTAEADAVIGCDGIKSNVRRMVLGANDPAANAVFSGKYAYRGLVPMEKAAGLLGDELAMNSQIYVGHHGHVLTFPIEQGKTMNVVAFRASKTPEWENDHWVLPMKREDMDRDFDGWGEQVRGILSMMEKPDVWALFNHPPANTYYKGRICLLGDSAHASTPHQGAGAGMALEDAYVLSRVLDVHSVDEIEGAFRLYDELRRERTQKVVVTSKAVSHIYELENPETGDDASKVAEKLENWYKWIWDFQLDVDLKKALQKKESL